VIWLSKARAILLRTGCVLADSPVDGVVGLVPLHMCYAFERDGDEDVVRIILDTTLGEFAVWLPLGSATRCG
jgi:hypothetical protein